ncbi:MAG TPA: amidohydrolase family protein [Edaphobacter sp.]|nr:amidohydrolase family protein [Edaphobacter sp.]
MLTIHGRDPASLKVLEVRTEDGLITEVRPSDASADLWLAPGFVDLQVNGYGGIDLNDVSCTPSDILRLSQQLATLGTTTFIPTIITASSQKIEHLLRTIRTAREEFPFVYHAVPWVHLEGPSISPLEGFCGAHEVEFVHAPSLSEFDHWQTVSGGLVRMVTLSPHWEESAEFIRSLRKCDVLVSIGHTHATRDQIRCAVDAGASLSTHLGNGIALTLPRHDNPIWPQLSDERLKKMFIADGIHLPGDVLRAMLRATGKEHSILVSDSVALAGSPAGSYRTNVGSFVTVSPDGSIRLKGSQLLAGSGIALKDAIARAVAIGGVSLGEAIQFATENPGQFAARRGRLEPGSPADLVRFRWNPGDQSLNIEDVLVMGNRISA